VNFVTYEALNRTIVRGIHKLPLDVDLIVGIPRSGLMVASIIALYRNIQFVDIDAFVSGSIYDTGSTRRRNDWPKSPLEAKHVLVVDDSVSTGSALNLARAKIASSGYTCRVTYCAIFSLITNFRLVDIYFEICNHPRMFEWNYMHHWGLEHACVDIDGVLCCDPTLLQNDDSHRYKEFLVSAIPKIIPSQKIGYLVTCRLEKYRSLTEHWLKSHGVNYDKLVMLDVPDARTRRKQITQGEFKAKIYSQSGCFIFIESSYEQSVDICNFSGKPVYCVENSQVVLPDNVASHAANLLNDWRITLKRVVKRLYRK
jgi:uncharacterized HAD superfamily protein/hypoxanthine phosphoribosyltransferase